MEEEDDLDWRPGTPPMMGESAAADQPGSDFFSQQLQTLYAKHNPKKLAEIPALLKKYRGREKDLLAAVSMKYGSTAIPIPVGATSPTHEAHNSSIYAGERQKMQRRLELLEGEVLELRNAEEAGRSDEAKVLREALAANMCQQEEAERRRVGDRERILRLSESNEAVLRELGQEISESNRLRAENAALREQAGRRGAGGAGAGEQGAGGRGLQGAGGGGKN
jgi:hypothetical protein